MRVTCPDRAREVLEAGRRLLMFWRARVAPARAMATKGPRTARAGFANQNLNTSAITCTWATLVGATALVVGMVHASRGEAHGGDAWRRSRPRRARHLIVPSGGLEYWDGRVVRIAGCRWRVSRARPVAFALDTAGRRLISMMGGIGIVAVSTCAGNTRALRKHSDTTAEIAGVACVEPCGWLS